MISRRSGYGTPAASVVRALANVGLLIARVVADAALERERVNAARDAIAEGVELRRIVGLHDLLAGGLLRYRADIGRHQRRRNIATAARDRTVGAELRILFVWSGRC